MLVMELHVRLEISRMLEGERGKFSESGVKWTLKIALDPGTRIEAEGLVFLATRLRCVAGAEGWILT
jgi:hypothetical protein